MFFLPRIIPPSTNRADVKGGGGGGGGVGREANENFLYMETKTGREHFLSSR